MRFGEFGVGLAFCGALWAAGAGAEPVIVDPDPDPNLDWGLRVEPVVSGLESPSALVFFGPRENEEFLVLEKNTGKVRHFVRRVEQPVALDLAVDRCGERGLLGIALHPDFDPAPTPVTAPPTDRPPSQDWVYLSYHTGTVADGCDPSLGAVLRVERYHWDGTLLVPDPLAVSDPNPADEFEPFAPFELDVDATGAVGGAIATSLDLGFDADNLVARLYVAIGSLDRDGLLQNNKLGTGFDDTGVILRLDQNGDTPADNPFDDDVDDHTDPEDRYFAYGIRSPRGLVVDPFSSPFGRTLWFTERSDALSEAEAADLPDEISPALAGTNSGYRVFQGHAATVPPNTDPLYPLVDLDVDTADPPKPVRTYLNPGFSFEDKGIDPTGLAFGGREVGPQNFGSLFVGAKDGRLFRFALNAPRSGFVLTGGLTDTVAAVASVGAAADDLTQIVVGAGFGSISDVEAGLDGSIYVLGADGAIHHVFTDAVRDLAVSSAKVPARVSLSAKKPKLTKRIRVTLENRGEVSERILSKELPGLIGLEISGLPFAANCAAPTANVIVPRYARPPYAEVIGIKPKGKLSISIDVVWACASPSPKGQFDFGTRIDLDGSVIGIVEDEARRSNNVCPRKPSTDDKGCGGKTVLPAAPDAPIWIPTDIVPK